MSGSNCGHCHTCGTFLINVLDGEQWCPRCQCYRRYRSHGFASWGSSADGESPCLEVGAIIGKPEPPEPETLVPDTCNEHIEEALNDLRKKRKESNEIWGVIDDAIRLLLVVQHMLKRRVEEVKVS